LRAQPGRGAGQRLRIAQVARPLETVPPVGYGGTERIVDELVRELDRRGHEVTTFASGDSRLPRRHVTTVPRALRAIGLGDDPDSSFRLTVELALEQQDRFDLIHAHLDRWNLELADRARGPGRRHVSQAA
jgi:glycosyltransferase involved in cell wall biosynthesis